MGQGGIQHLCGRAWSNVYGHMGGLFSATLMELSYKNPIESTVSPKRQVKDLIKNENAHRAVAKMMNFVENPKRK